MSPEFRPNDRVKVLLSGTWDWHGTAELGTVVTVATDFLRVQLDTRWQVWVAPELVKHLIDSPALIPRDEIARALVGDAARASNADEFETEMLQMLAAQERAKGGTKA